MKGMNSGDDLISELAERGYGLDEREKALAEREAVANERDAAADAPNDGRPPGNGAVQKTRGNPRVRVGTTTIVLSVVFDNGHVCLLGSDRLVNWIETALSSVWVAAALKFSGGPSNAFLIVPVASWLAFELSV